MPEGDTLRRVVERLGPLAGEVVSAAAPHPRAAALGIAERIDGRRLEGVEAVGKNLLLTFEGGIVLRSHLRMRGRWSVRPAGTALAGKPWLVLRGRGLEAVLWNGPVLELGARARERLGPDIMDDSPDVDGMLVRFRAADQARELGEALLDQTLVAGIGNRWRAEGLFRARVSPWARLAELSDDDLRRVLLGTSEAMRVGDRRRSVYGRSGRPCPRCGTPVAVGRQGDDARATYWCPGCQGGTERPGA